MEESELPEDEGTPITTVEVWMREPVRINAVNSVTYFTGVAYDFDEQFVYLDRGNLFKVLIPIDRVAYISTYEGNS